MIFVLRSKFILMRIFCVVEIFWFQIFVNLRILPMRLKKFVNLRNSVRYITVMGKF